MKPARMNTGNARSLRGTEHVVQEHTRGAPFQMTGAVRRNIFTDAESWATAQRIGNGNASLGIRLALAAYPGEK